MERLLTEEKIAELLEKTFDENGDGRRYMGAGGASVATLDIYPLLEAQDTKTRTATLEEVKDLLIAEREELKKAGCYVRYIGEFNLIDKLLKAIEGLEKDNE